MKSRYLNILVIVNMVISLFLNTIPVAAQEDPFPLPDVDGDSLSNDLEIDGWYNLSGGPYRTDPYDRDSDDDGLTDGEEKLFDTNPLDLHSPGIAVKYEDSFETRQYFNTTDPAYLSIKQGGDQFLLQEALVIRRGTTFTIAGPARGTLTLTGTNMTAITPFRDPANGGWSITIPMNGTVGTYIATVSDGYWTKSMPVYVIFEIPDDLPQDEVDAFLYDGDSENKRDEVVPFFRMDEWPYYNQHNINPGCPYPEDPNQPCSNWQYHLAFGYSQAYWTEQFTKSAFVDHAIKGMHGKTSQADATYSLSRWFDTEFRTQHGRLQNNWSSAMYSWFDGIGYTASGGYCETTATTYAAILRSAGIPASVFQIDYNKTVGHGESGQFGNTYEYDTSTMMWYGGRWYAQRAYSGASDDGTYYPWNLGVTAITTLDTYIDGPGYYYSDRYGDGIFSVNQDWDFQIGSNAGGTVNQVWPIPSAEWASINRDYQWDSKLPLQITQSPDVEVMNYLFFNDDNWQPSEWRRPPVSDPPGRNEYLTYILPDGVIDPENELENWPISPRPIACSPATPADECAAFLASWTPENTINSSLAVSSAVEKGAFTLFLPLINNQNSTVASIELGKIIDDNSIDIDGDGYFDELIVKFEVTSSVESVVRFGGFLDIGENELRGATKSITLKPGTQIVEISFDGFEIADNKVDGPYTVKALWAANPDQTDLVFVDPGKTLDYQDYSYSTNAYQYSQFEILAATIDSDGISHMGIDNDKNGLFESIVINIPLIIDIPGSLSVDGDLYDSRGDFVGNATWTGIDKEAKLKFNVVKTSPPYKLEHLKLTITNGEILDSRFATSYEINDMDGKIEAGNVIIGSGSSGDPSLSQPLGVDPTGVYTIIPVDTNVNGLFDKLRVEVGVTVTESGGDYRIEGLLEDDHGTEIAWVVSDPQPLTIGNRTMTLDFDGKMLYDQLPLTGARAFKLVAVKIFSGNLSTTTLESEAKFATNTPAYTRNQFEPSSTAITLFQDDLENGTSQWALTGTFWNLNSGTWNSWTNAWVASSTVNGSGQLTIDPPLDFSDYAGPVLHFDNAYRLGSSLDKGVVEVSINGGTTWTAIETYNGVDTSPHWMTEDVDLSAFGEMADVQLRFNATRGSTSGILWYLDDIYINAWPAVKTASFTYPIEVIAGEPATFTASYTSIDTTIPVSYKWSFNGEEVITSSPTTNLSIPEIGDVSVTLTVSSPYDSASSTQTITVLSNPDQFILNVDVTPFAGGTVTRNPDQIAFDPGTEVILTAVPNEGYTFNGWSGGGCSGMGTCIVTMNADTTITAEFVPIEYDLTILLDGFGEVSQNPEKETYHYGDEVQLTALPGPTYGFSQWSGDLVSTTESVIITIDGDKLITAEFVPGYSVAVNNIGSGTITKYPDKETYLPGEQVTLTPFPDLNWEFSNWSGGCTGNGACVVTMNSNIDVTATFTKSQFTLKFGIHGNGTILKDPDQVTYSSGQRVILTANPDENWRFSGWGSALTGSVNPSAITITGDTTVFATFVDTFPFPAATISPTNSGTVTKSPSRTTYTYGSAVIVTAVPNPGFLFDHWEGSCTGSTNPCLVTVDGNESVTAYFTAIEYTLLAKTIGLGSVSKDPFKATYHYGDVVSLNAIGNNGWTFDSWSGGITGIVNPQTITVDGNENVTATFNQNPYTLGVNIIGSGLVTKDPYATNYSYGTEVTLIPTPGEGWSFSEWSGDCTGSGSCVVTINDDINVAAIFTPNSYTLGVSVIGSGTVTKSPDQPDYIYGTEVTLVPTPAAGWSFSEWEGSCIGSGVCVLTIDGNESVTANFVEQTGTKLLTVNVTGNGSVTQNPLPPYTDGTGVDLTAVPATGWQFVNWTGACTGGGACSVTLDTDKTVGATFAMNTHSLTVTPPVNGTITPSSGTFEYGSEVELIATPADHYEFASWTGACAGQSVPCSILMDADKTVGATFEYDTFTLTVNQPVSGGTISPETSDYAYGTDVTLTATSLANYHFLEWTGACGGQLTNTCDVTVNQDMEVSAVFGLLVTIEQTAGGTINHSTTYHTFGSVVTLTATPATGYALAQWNGDCSGTVGTTCNLTIDGPKTVSATFIQQTRTLTINNTPAAGGTTIPSGGTYPYGTVVDVFPNPETGYKFDHWSGACSGSGACQLTMTADRSVTAYFTQVYNNLTVGVDPIGGGTTNPAVGVNPITEGSVINVTATSNPGFVFDHWSGACSGTGTCNVTMNIPQSVTAHFTPILHDLTISVDPVGGGVTSPTVGVHSYLEGTVVPISAFAAIGYTFDYWEGNCTGTGTCQVTMDSDKSVKVYFEPYTATFTLTYIAGPNGTISGDTTQFVNIGANGTSVTAVPNTGYQFVNWSDGSIANPRTDTNVTADITVTANFELTPPDCYALTLTHTGMGTNPEASPTNSVGCAVGTYIAGANITLSGAVPATGWQIVSWTGTTNNSSTAATNTVNMPAAAHTAGVNYTQITYTLTYIAGTGGTLTGETTQTVNYGANGTSVTAVPNTGYSFVDWSDGSTANPRTDTNVTANITVTANFAINTYTLTYTAGTGGTLTGDTTQTVNYGGSGTSVTAVPNTGYHFVDWSDGSIANPRTDINVTADITVTANFELTPPDCYALTLTHSGTGTNPEASPTNSVGCAVGKYIAGANITLSGAVPATGWQIVSWTGTTNNSSTAATNTVNMPAAAHTAGVNYTQITYTLTYIAGTGGTLTGETTQTVNYGANGTSVTAVPNTGYSFVDWSDGSTANPRTDTNVTANITVTANFAINTYTLTYTAGTGGTLTGETTQTVNYGGSGTSVTAVPNTGYYFVDWSDGSIANPRTDINVTADITVTANFELTPPDCYALTLTHTGMGTNPEASPTNSVGCAVGTYIAGANITLSGAVPATGWQIVSWTGTTNNSSTAATNTVNMPAAAHTAGVNYTQITYTLTYIAGTGGTLTGETTQTVNYGANGTSVTAVPNTGYSFVDWSDGSTANPRTDTNVTANITVTANFAINTYTLTVISEHGTVSKAPDLTTYNHGTEVLLTMSSVDPGWTFVAWSGGGCSGAVPCTVTITSDTTVTAVFSQNQYFIFIPLVVGGSIVSDPNQDSYVYGDEVLLTAVPDPGYVFGEWSGDCSGTNQTCLLLMENNKNVSATFFLAVEGTLTINAAIGGTITADPAGPYLIGDEVTLTATADTGYTFTGWTDDLSGTTNPITFTLESDMVVGASFTQELITLPKDLITDPGILRENFESMDGWIVSGSGSGFYASVDTTNYKEGEAAIKMTTPATTGNVAITKAVNWDMATPDEQGNFRFWVYVHGTAAPRDFQILMSNDASFQNYFITYYNASYKFTNLPGWNQVNLRASDWRVGAGSPSWTEPITRVRFRIYGTSVASYSLDGLASGVTAMPAVVFTFDDADASLWTQAYAYMNDKNVRGTGYVVTDWVEGTNKVTWAQLQEMESAGWTIGNHTKAHTDLSLLTLAEQEAALLDARTVLSDHGITNSDYVAYPYGNYNEDTMMAMENLGMRLGRTMVAANNVSPLQSPFEISQREVIRWLPLSTVQTWVNTAVARQEILVLTFHDIGTSPTSSGWYVDRFRSLVDYLISQDIPIITMDDLYRLQSGDIGSPTECYTLTITHTGEGIDPVANPSNSDGCAVGTYLAGESITLSGAAPDTGWRITSWTGTINNGSTAVTNTVNMPAAAHAAGVNYIQITYTLTYIAGPGGSLTGETTQIVNYGANGTSVTAVPNIGYQFVNWSDGSISNPRTDTNVTADMTVTANFAIDTYTLSYSAGVGGTLSGETTQTVNYGSNGTAVTAVPNTGYSFVDWSDGSTENPRIDTNVTANITVTANFAFGTVVTLTINAAIGGTITADPAGPYLIGDEVTLTATADTGYTFTGWTDDLSGTTNPITFTLESDMVVGASFTQELITLPKDLITDPGILRENFESMDGWIVSGSGSGFYASVDTTNYKEGEAAIKMTTPATTGNVAITKAVNWDMATPDEQGNFRFWVYVHGTAAPRDFQILMSNDASFQNYFITYYNASYKFTNLPGWNQVNLRASDWRVGAGSPSWTEPITRVRFRIYGTSVASYSLDGLASGVTAMPAVVFTFDDADASLWTQAYAYMNDKNVRGTGYVVTDWVDGTNKVTWAQLQEMESAGWTIGNHTKAHTDLSLLTLAEQEAALMDARTALSDHGITNSDYVAYPYGNYNDDTLMAMENLGMRLGRTMVAANNVSPLQSPFEISQREVIRWLPLSTVQTWVNTAVARQEILVLTFHDIGTSPTATGWYVDRFRSLVDYLISQDIPIITMDDLYRLQSGGIGIPVPD